MFTLHQINAFEDNGFLVMDMCCGDNGEVIGDFTLENLRRESGEEMDKVVHTYMHVWMCGGVFFFLFKYLKCGWSLCMPTFNSPLSVSSVI